MYGYLLFSLQDLLDMDSEKMADHLVAPPPPRWAQLKFASYLGQASALRAMWYLLYLPCGTCSTCYLLSLLSTYLVQATFGPVKQMVSTDGSHKKYAMKSVRKAKVLEMGQEMLKEYMKGKEFKGHAKTLPFCRLWCVVEIAAALRFDVALVFKCCTTADGRSKQFVAGRGAVNLLTNATSMVNIEAADAAVAEDKHRDHG